MDNPQGKREGGEGGGSCWGSEHREMLHPLGNVLLAWLVVGIEVLLENHLAVVADPRRPAIKVIVAVQVGPEVVLAAGRAGCRQRRADARECRCRICILVSAGQVSGAQAHRPVGGALLPGAAAEPI